MEVNLYNSLTRQKEVFQPILDNTARIYSCGPTVYWFAHIGNFRAYIFVDVLRRTLTRFGYTVKLIMNITDVGHLTDDADEGEDKMFLAMRREGKTSAEIAQFYENAFFEDSKKLNILHADVYPRATGHISEQIAMIQQMEKNGYTYQTSDGIYFDTSKLARYGQLSRQKLEDKKAGSRIEVGEKKHGTDFALWKFSPKDAQRDMEWESPWGKGFPGWHIECSAMSKKYLDVPFDIHTGGIDHIAVHHENEIAQSFASDGVMPANVWMHNEFIVVDGQKLSKSLKNSHTISELVEKGFDPLAYRYFVLGAHYRTLLNFTFDALTAAQNALNKLRAHTRNFQKGTGGAEEYEGKFFSALADDLNTPEALAAVWEMAGDDSISIEDKGASLVKFDEILGLGLTDIIGVADIAPVEVVKLIQKRELARSEQNWSESDMLRKKIEKSGWTVEDTSDGAKARRL